MNVIDMYNNFINKKRQYFKDFQDVCSNVLIKHNLNNSVIMVGQFNTYTGHIKVIRSNNDNIPYYFCFISDSKDYDNRPLFKKEYFMTLNDLYDIDNYVLTKIIQDVIINWR